VQSLSWQNVYAVIGINRDPVGSLCNGIATNPNIAGLIEGAAALLNLRNRRFALELGGFDPGRS
jgi:hypothetical protein